MTLPPRGIRNNNPGNLNFAHQPDAVMEPKTALVPNPRFAKFPTMDAGVSALIHQLTLYFSRGTNTVTAIIGQWAPSFENPTNAYVSYVARSMNVQPRDTLEATPETLAQLACAIAHMENGVLPFTEAHALELARVVVGVKGGAA